MLTSKFFIANRKKLMKKISDNSVVIIFSGTSFVLSLDKMSNFYVDRNFFYLTGVKQMNSLLILSKINGIVHERIVSLEKDISKERWLGVNLSVEEITSISGINDVILDNDYQKYITNTEDYKLIESVYLVFSPYQTLPLVNHLENTFQEYIKNNLKNIKIVNLYEFITKMRLIKQPAEIKEIRQAIKLTNKALLNTFKKIPNMKYEYEALSLYNYEIRKRNSDISFNSIVSSGVNTNILHYESSSAKIEWNSIMQFDVGALSNCYASDISRAVPTYKKFSKLQKDVYNAVLRIQEDLISALKPGLTRIEANNIYKSSAIRELKKLGLIKKDEEVFKYIWHSFGHSLGLDVHDATLSTHKGSDIFTRADIKCFEPGMVYTVEPGIYIEEYGFGIRIEDDILITKDGNENLSKDIIKSIEDIEGLYDKK